MQPPDSLFRAATRWLNLLRTSTVQQASAILRADANYADLTSTQYASALDWLTALSFLRQDSSGLTIPAQIRSLSVAQLNQLLFERTLEALRPSWLLDADVLVQDSTDLPADAARLASSLGLTSAAALLSIHRAHGRVNLEELARIGAAGELALVQLLERLWCGSTTHVSLVDDGFGYDLALRVKGIEWHLEIKTTTRRGRLVIFLSRHEYEVGRQDPTWRLIVVGMNDQLHVDALATVCEASILERAPVDQGPDAAWQAVRHQLHADDLQLGLGFLPGLDATSPDARLIQHGSRDTGSSFAWLPAFRVHPTSGL